MYKKMDIFFRNPQREISVREYARFKSISPTTASTLLKKLVKEGMLIARKERNYILYKANINSDTYKDAKLNYNIKAIRSSGLIDYLVKELREPLAIVLFGSYAKAENHPGSDIDLFIVSRTKKELDLAGFEKKLKSPIQLFIESDINNLNNPHLINNIINGAILYGFLEVFNV